MTGSRAASILLVLAGLAAEACDWPGAGPSDEETSGDGDTGLATTRGSESSSGGDDPTGSTGSTGTTTWTTGTTSETGATTDGIEPPGATVLELSFSQVKQFDFSWAAAAGAEHYELLESAAPGEAFVQIGGDVHGESISIAMPLHSRYEASYVLRSCNDAGCTESAPVSVMGSLAEAVGYFKASNTDAEDVFGVSVALSGDGNTLAVGATGEDGNATGIDGDRANDSFLHAGAVYVFVRDPMDQWSQQAYVKASNASAGDLFGHSVALSDDGNTLAVGAVDEDSTATGIDGDQANNSGPNSGAAYVFVRAPMQQWVQQAYVKASNTDAYDHFGYDVALSGDGSTLAVTAQQERGNATGIDGDQSNDSLLNAGAAYVFVRDAMDQWSQQAYVKASNTSASDFFGRSVALSGNGNTLAVGATGEDSNATGIDGDQSSEASSGSGAVYVFVRDPMQQWSQQAYVKASNTNESDSFGHDLALSDDGKTLAVGAVWEDGNATGIDGDQSNNAAGGSGAVYVFVHDPMQQWAQQAYVKTSNTNAGDLFGRGIALTADGNILAVGAHNETSDAVGIDGNQADDSLDFAGAAYVFVRSEIGQWSQQAYVKASNTGADDTFGYAIALSGDGNTLAVGAPHEASSATGIGGDQLRDLPLGSGAVYLY